MAKNKLNKIKSLLLFTVAGIMAILTTNCKSEESKIKSVAEEFLTAYYVDYNYDKAEKLATMESRLTIANKKESTDANYFAKSEKATIILGNVNIKSENYAEVQYMANEMNKLLVFIRNNKTNKWEVDTYESGIDGSNLAPNAKSGFASSQSDATPI
jgi:hypothetical protein